jgi:hypothetical protein
MVSPEVEEGEPEAIVEDDPRLDARPLPGK